MNFADFLLVELIFYLSVALDDILGRSTCRPHVFQHPKRFDALSIKDVASASHFRTVSLDAFSTLSLLPDSRSLHRCWPHPNRRKSLIDGKSLQ